MVSKIQKGLSNYFDNHMYQLKNTYFFSKTWESDYFSMTKTGYTYEVEIKVSASDFKADFKKEKHKLFEKAVTNTATGNRGRILVKTTKQLIPNRFFFCVPLALRDKLEIPPYAGLLLYDPVSGAISKATEAPFLHKDKPDLTGKLLHKFYWKSITLENELEKYKPTNTVSSVKRRKKRKGKK
jgi:hypothetical protein